MLYVGAALVVCMVGLFLIREVVAPVFLAITLVLTVRPMVVWLNDHKVPKLLSASFGIIVVFAVLIAILFAVTIAFAQFVGAVPTYAAEFNALLDQALSLLASWGISSEAMTEYLRTFDFTRLIGAVTGFVSQIGSVAGFLGSLFLFVAFVAVDMTDTSERYSRLTSWRPNLSAALVDFTWRVRRYWVVNTVFGLCVALINMGILAWLQIPLVLTWGILAFVCAYIPNIGFIIALIPPAIMALLSQGWETMVVMVAAYLVVNFISHMIIQPKVTGHAVGLNITTTFVSLVFWAIIIGPMGAILAVPLTLFFKCILFDAYPRTLWVSIFMGGELDDDALPGDTVPPLEAPPVVEDPELQPEPEPPAAATHTAALEDEAEPVPGTRIRE